MLSCMFLGLDASTWAFAAIILLVAVRYFVLRRKRGPLEWDPHPPTTRDRIIAGVWLAVLLLAAVNFYADWYMFHGYDKPLLAGVGFLGLLIFARMPGVRHTQ